jgi:hypothetical protein
MQRFLTFSLLYGSLYTEIVAMEMIKHVMDIRSENTRQ